MGNGTLGSAASHLATLSGWASGRCRRSCQLGQRLFGHEADDGDARALESWSESSSGMDGSWNAVELADAQPIGRLAERSGADQRSRDR